MKYKLIEKNINSIHKIIIKKLRLFHPIPTNPNPNKIEEKFKQANKGIISLFKQFSTNNLSI